MPEQKNKKRKYFPHPAILRTRISYPQDLPEHPPGGFNCFSGASHARYTPARHPPAGAIHRTPAQSPPLRFFAAFSTERAPATAPQRPPCTPFSLPGCPLTAPAFLLFSTRILTRKGTRRRSAKRPPYAPFSLPGCPLTAPCISPFLHPHSQPKGHPLPLRKTSSVRPFLSARLSADRPFSDAVFRSFRRGKTTLRSARTPLASGRKNAKKVVGNGRKNRKTGNRTCRKKESFFVHFSQENPASSHKQANGNLFLKK